MFVISCSNVYICETTHLVGLDEGRKSPIRKWETYGQAMIAARNINARFGMNTYVHRAERTDLQVGMVDTHDFGYSKV